MDSFVRNPHAALLIQCYSSTTVIPMERAVPAIMLVAASMLAGMYPSSAAASDYKLGYNTNASENDYVFTTKSPKGTIGKSMSIPFRIRATDEDMENLRISLLETNEFQQIEERGNGDYSVDYYPFEIMETTFVAKNVGTIKKGNVKSVSLSARVRRDALQGYYSIPVLLEWDGGSDTDYINVWISTSSTSGADEEEDKKEGNYLWWERTSPPPGRLSQCHGLHRKFPQ